MIIKRQFFLLYYELKLLPVKFCLSIMSLFKWGNTFYCGSCRDVHLFVMRNIQSLCNVSRNLSHLFLFCFNSRAVKWKYHLPSQPESELLRRMQKRHTRQNWKVYRENQHAIFLLHTKYDYKLRRIVFLESLEAIKCISW